MDFDTHPSEWVLDPNGLHQIENINNYLDNFDHSKIKIYCSEEKKTHLTMKNYAEKYDINITTLKGLNELQFKKLIHDREKFIQFRRKQFDSPNFSLEESETPQSALQRFNEAINKIQSRKDHELSVVCSHGTILTLYFGNLLDLDGEEMFEMWSNLSFGAIGVIDDGKVEKSIFENH